MRGPKILEKYLDVMQLDDKIISSLTRTTVPMAKLLYTEALPRGFVSASHRHRWSYVFSVIERLRLSGTTRFSANTPKA